MKEDRITKSVMDRISDFFSPFDVFLVVRSTPRDMSLSWISRKRGNGYTKDRNVVLYREYYSAWKCWKRGWELCVTRFVYNRSKDHCTRINRWWVRRRAFGASLLLVFRLTRRNHRNRRLTVVYYDRRSTRRPLFSPFRSLQWPFILSLSSSHFKQLPGAWKGWFSRSEASRVTNTSADWSHKWTCINRPTSKRIAPRPKIDVVPTITRTFSGRALRWKQTVQFQQQLYKFSWILTNYFVESGKEIARMTFKWISTSLICTEFLVHEPSACSAVTSTNSRSSTYPRANRQTL